MDTQKVKTVNSLPLSSSNYYINLFCLIFFFAVMIMLHHVLPEITTIKITTLSLLATVIPLWLYDFVSVGVQKRPSTGLDIYLREVDKERLVVKLIGLYGTFVIVLVYYYVIYAFFAATYLKAFFDFLGFSSPWIIILCFFYFLVIGRRQTDPYDEYWHAGCFLMGRFSKVNLRILNGYARAWFIKGFFTPYVFLILVRYVESFFSFDWKQISFLSFYYYFLDLIYMIDIIYGVLGYILTCRLLDTHIRSTDPTILGWVVCLICYGPFYSYFGIGLLNYDDGFQWNQWFAFSPLFYYFYGITILFLSLVYGLATVAFGYRASNLTYRGIITSGPYRSTKHPAYLCKTLSWWLISLPFFSVEGPLAALKYTFSLSIISFIYYLRAKTEENHLYQYPEYVAYANWIKEHGVFSFITRRFPTRTLASS